MIKHELGGIGAVVVSREVRSLNQPRISEREADFFSAGAVHRISPRLPPLGKVDHQRLGRAGIVGVVVDQD